MPQALLIRLRPLGPWRSGPGDGGQDRVDTLFRSDRLYSALTLAMQQLGWLEEWLEATARGASPAVVAGSLFPFQGDTLFAPPPASLWPPPASLVTTPSPVFLSKIRWRAARFVPLSIVEAILAGQTILADQWIPDAESGCLLRRDRPNSSPFRTVLRSTAAVDRLTETSARAHTTACLEFEAGSGLWTVVRYRDAAASTAWHDRLKGAFRLLADTGFGARRSSGWGQAAEPEFQEGAWPSLLFPKLARLRSNGTNGHPADHAPENSEYWLLSLYSPALSDAVDWAAGAYELTVRGGHVQSRAGSGLEKKRVRMVTEGSVIAAGVEPAGAAIDVAPEGFAHPVYRSGLALTLRLPVLSAPLASEGPVEEAGREADVVEPCPPAEVPAPEPEPNVEPVSEEIHEVEPEPEPEPVPEESPAENTEERPSEI